MRRDPLADAGMAVACIATSQENAAPTVEAIRARGHHAIALGCHVEQAADVARTFGTARKELGALDVLINNVGVIRPQPILDMSEEDWDNQLNINVKSVFLCSQIAVRQMVEAGRSGCIINIGSVAAENAFPHRLAYCASKAAVHQMTRVMAIEWAAYGIRVNAIAPGYVLTERMETLAREGNVDISQLEHRVPQRRLGTAEEIATAAVFLAGAGARYITGSILTVDGGWQAYGYL